VRFDSEKREWCKGGYVISMYWSTVAMIENNPVPKKKEKKNNK